MDAEDRNDDESGGQEQETPVCLNCFRPVSPLDHVCPHCGEAVGQLTPSLPFESVRWQAQTWGKACRQIWSPGTSTGGRWFRLLMVILSAPVLIIAIFVAGVFALVRPSRRRPRAGS